MGRTSNAAVVAVIIALAVMSGLAASEAARDADAVKVAISQPPESSSELETAPGYQAGAVVVGAARSNAHGWRSGRSALQVRDAAPVRPELVDAYTLAQLLAPASCNLPVSLLAAIGQVESGSLVGRRVDVRNRVHPPVLGPVLNGARFRKVPDSDRGALDGHRRWDRAVGPMQLLPATWRAVGFDADGDGARDPQNVYDAAGAAMTFLCQSGRDLSTRAGVQEAVLAYNGSRRYLRLVLAWQQAYDDRGLVEVTWEPPGAELVIDPPLAQALRARSALTLDSSPVTRSTRPAAPRTSTAAPSAPALTTPAASTPVPTTTTTAAETPSSAAPTSSAPTCATPTATAGPSESPTGTPTGPPTGSPTGTANGSPTSTATESPTAAQTATPTGTSTATPTEPPACAESAQAPTEERRNR